MEIDVSGENPFFKENRPDLQQIIEWICSQLELPVKSISIIFTDNKNISMLHNRYFKDDSPTDVITFNLGTLDEIEAEIYISQEYSREQAKIYGVPYIQEISRLLVHSMLHLAGYDDQTGANRKQMKRVENNYVKFISENYLN